MDVVGSHHKEHKQKEPKSKDDQTKATIAVDQSKSQPSDAKDTSNTGTKPAASPEKDKEKDQTRDQPRDQPSTTPVASSKPVSSTDTPKPTNAAPTLKPNSSTDKSSASTSKPVSTGDKPNTPASTSKTPADAPTDKSHSTEKPKPALKLTPNPNQNLIPKPKSSSAIQLSPSSTLVLFRAPKGGLAAMSHATQNGIKIELPQPASIARTSKIEKRCLGRMASQTPNEKHLDLSIWSSSFAYPRIRAAYGVPTSNSGDLTLFPNFHSLLDVHMAPKQSVSTANQNEDVVNRKVYPAPRLCPQVAVKMLPSSKRMRDDDGADVRFTELKKHKDKKAKKSKHRDGHVAVGMDVDVDGNGNV